MIEPIRLTPMMYAKAIRDALNTPLKDPNNPNEDLYLTVHQLAFRIGKTSEWVSRQLTLLNLDLTIQRKLDELEVPLASAYGLAKIKPDHQIMFIGDIQKLSVYEFAMKLERWKLHNRRGKRPVKGMEWIHAASSSPERVQNSSGGGKETLPGGLD